MPNWYTGRVSHYKIGIAVLSAIGLLFLTGFDVTANRVGGLKLRKEVLFLMVFVIGLYLLSMVFEQDCYIRACTPSHPPFSVSTKQQQQQVRHPNY
jgi:hypothetical protein